MPWLMPVPPSFARVNPGRLSTSFTDVKFQRRVPISRRSLGAAVSVSVRVSEGHTGDEYAADSRRCTGFPERLRGNKLAPPKGESGEGRARCKFYEC